MSNEYWKSDLSCFAVTKEAAGYRVIANKPGVPVSPILNTNGRNRWRTVTHISQDKDDRPHSWTNAEVIEIIRAQTSVPDLKVQLLNRSAWRVARHVAGRFHKGQVLLVGEGNLPAVTLDPISAVTEACLADRNVRACLQALASHPAAVGQQL